jgi:hypothetical protein
MESCLDLVDVPARHRAAALEAWLTTQAGVRGEDRARAAERLVAELGALLDAAERAAFLDAPGLRWPLATLADASRGSTAATLWAWAAISAGIEGELADVAPELAVRAILADPELPLAWEAFEEAVRAYVPPDLFGRVREWRADAELAVVAARATDVFEAGHEAWPDEDRRRFERYKRGVR